MKTQLKKALLLRPTDRGSKLLIGVVVALVLLITPFLFYSYRLVPVTLEETNVLGMNIKAGAHGNLNYFAYYLFTKLVFLLLFCVWFITCHHWWRWAILVPISMLTFQVTGVLNTSVGYIDEFDFWYSLPVVLAVTIFMVAIAKKLNFYATGLDLKDQIEEEISKSI